MLHSSGFLRRPKTILISSTFDFDITCSIFKSKWKLITNYDGLLKKPELYCNIRFPFKFSDKLVKNGTLIDIHVLKLALPFFEIGC